MAGGGECRVREEIIDGKARGEVLRNKSSYMRGKDLLPEWRCWELMGMWTVHLQY